MPHCASVPFMFEFESGWDVCRDPSWRTKRHPGFCLPQVVCFITRQNMSPWNFLRESLPSKMWHAPKHTNVCLETVEAPKLRFSSSLFSKTTSNKSSLKICTPPDKGTLKKMFAPIKGTTNSAHSQQGCSRSTCRWLWPWP